MGLGLGLEGLGFLRDLDHSLLLNCLKAGRKFLQC